MEQTLTLIANESFGKLPCSFYQQAGTDDILLTREQIGLALEYEHPAIAIGKIHGRHEDRISRFSVLTKLVNAADGKEYDTYFYNPKGVMEICRWSRQPKANAFMDFVWDVMDKLMRGEARLTPTHETALAIQQTNEKLDAITAACKELQTKVKSIEKTSSYSNYYLRLQARSGYDQRWEQRAIRKVKAVAEFIGTEDTQLLRRIYQEMESRYGIVLDDFVKDYKRVKRITRCSTLSVVSFSFPLREMFDAIVGELCAVCGIENDNGQQLGLVESIAEALAFREVEA